MAFFKLISNTFLIQMKKTSAVLAGILLVSISFKGIAVNTNYVTNKSPLIEVPYTPLPVGAVKADGWLLKQLQQQKDGLTGYSEILYNGANDLGPDCDWLGGSGNSWERAPYYTKGLVALAYVLNDASLITKAKKWVNWSINSQLSSGYFGPTNNSDWWARMPMLYAIRDFYDATGDTRVIPFLTKYFQYENANIDSRTLTDWGKSRAGDNIEIVYWLYNHTDDAFLLTLADKLKGQAYNWTDIYSNNKFFYFLGDFQPKHNVNVPQAMKMPAIYYQKSQLVADKQAFILGREHLMCDHGQPEGMQSGNEMLAGRSAMAPIEMCSFVEQMQSCETAQMIIGDATIGDQLEKIAFNGLPGGMSKDFKVLQYYTQANQIKSVFGGTGFGQNYDNALLPGPTSGYPCCRFNLHMGWPYYVKTMWATTNDNGLAAMAYGPSHVTALVGDHVQVTINENTDYPFNDQLSFALTTSTSVAFPLKLRIPAWCKTPEVKVNGVLQSGVVSGDFYSISRTWNDKDTVVLSLPMSIQLNDEVNNSVSVQRGPLVYSLKMQEQWTTRTDFGNGFKEYEVNPLSSWNYALVLDRNNPESSITVNKAAMPANPFVQATTPVTLTIAAKKVPSWTFAYNTKFACDPPYSPVETSAETETIVLVPFGSENIRVTCFPVVGTANLVDDQYLEEFNDIHQTGWANYSGNFFVNNGEYASTNLEGGSESKSVKSSTSFSDFTYDAKVKVTTNGDGGLLFRASKLSFGADEYNGYYAGISSSGKYLVLGKASGTWSQLKSVPMEIVSNQWYQVRVVTKGTNIKVYVDDMVTPKINMTDASFSSGCIGVRSYSANTRWDNITVTSSTFTGLKNAKIPAKFSVYPNPTTGKFQIKENGGAISDLKLCDLNGKVLKTFMNNDTVYDVSSFAKGVYLLEAKASGKKAVTKLIVE